MTISRRSFLGTLAGAIAVGFAKVETKMLEAAVPLAGAPETLLAPSLTFHGIPFHMNDGITSGVWMGIDRAQWAVFDLAMARPPHNARIDFEGASGDPTSDR